MGDNYKEAKEAFVTGMAGSTVLHINMISLVALLSIALHSALVSRLPPTKSLHLPTSWAVLTFPLLFSMTIFANNPGLLSILLMIPIGYFLSNPRHSGSPLPVPMSPNLRHSAKLSVSESRPQLAPLPFLTVYRAHMLLMTTLAILAVDFPVFPRSLAKCETFGVSLMDIGVGSFVFSQGLVSAIPLIKDPSYLSAPATLKLISVTRKSLPIILIGLVRVLLVKGTEYPEHESEYGTHWNFFITLALLPILQVILHPIIKRVPPALVGVMAAVAQQMALSFLGMHDFVLNAPRTSLISANKEGIVSLLGYLAVHLLGLSTGTLILPPSPKYFGRALKSQGLQRRNSDGGAPDQRNTLGEPRQNGKTAVELCSYSVVWWTLLGLTRLVGIGGDGVSRRMVNLPYIFWVAAYNTSFILGYMLLDLFFFPSKSMYSPKSKLKVPSSGSVGRLTSEVGGAPELLEAINKNGLVLFLLANVATGLVNIIISTMYTSEFRAMLILTLYAFGFCTAAWKLRDRRLLRL